MARSGRRRAAAVPERTSTRLCAASCWPRGWASGPTLGGRGKREGVGGGQVAQHALDGARLHCAQSGRPMSAPDAPCCVASSPVTLPAHQPRSLLPRAVAAQRYAPRRPTPCGCRTPMQPAPHRTLHAPPRAMAARAALAPAGWLSACHGCNSGSETPPARARACGSLRAGTPAHRQAVTVLECASIPNTMARTLGLGSGGARGDRIGVALTVVAVSAACAAALAAPPRGRARPGGAPARAGQRQLLRRGRQQPRQPAARDAKVKQHACARRGTPCVGRVLLPVQQQLEP